MTEPSMGKPDHTQPLSLERVLAFHRELLSVASTGLPVDLGFDSSKETLQQSLERMGSLIAVKCGLGHSIESAVAFDASQPMESNLPARYRASLMTWLQCDGSWVALDAAISPAVAQTAMRSQLRGALLQFMILTTLFFLGCILLCLFVSPKIDGLYEQTSSKPGPAQSVMQTIRDWLPWWLPVFAIGGVAAWVWIQRGLLRWRAEGLLGRTQNMESLDRANYAAQLAAMMDHQLPVSQALACLGPLPSATMVVESENKCSKFHRELPPVLRWATSDQSDDENRESVNAPCTQQVALAASHYRNSVAARPSRWTGWIPGLGLTLVGGLMVFLYGLGLFLPMVELLRHLMGANLDG